jgi:ABC-type nitrate/sulfonate/bicarbonate transport system substrate-binding protein
MFVCRLHARRVFVWLACAATLALSSPSSAQAGDPAKPHTKIRFVSTLSSSTFPVSYAIENGIFAKRGIDVEMLQFADFQAVYTAMRTSAADMGSGGLASIINLRGNGVPVNVIWGTSLMLNDILVKPDSGIKSLSDLKGKDIGVFGGASGTTANMFVAVLADQFGIDPRKDARIRFGAPTLLANMLVKGDIAAFVSNDPVTAIELAGGRVVTIGELGRLYADKHGGYYPYAGALTASDQFGKDNPEAVNAFLGAWNESVRALQASPSLWQPLLNKQMKINDPAVADLLMKRFTPLWTSTWTKRNVEGEIEALHYMNKVAGKGFLDRIPDDAFDLRFSPK